jgi:hypothetical protein
MTDQVVLVDGVRRRYIDNNDGTWSEDINGGGGGAGTSDASANNQIKQILMAGLADDKNWNYEILEMRLVSSYQATAAGSGFAVGDTLVRTRLVTIANAMTSPVETAFVTWTKNNQVLTNVQAASVKQISAELIAECKGRRTIAPDISQTLAPQLSAIQLSVTVPGTFVAIPQWQ